MNTGKALLLFLCSLSVAFAEVHTNPCEDSLYLTLRDRSIQSMTFEERAYLSLKKNQCELFLRTPAGQQEQTATTSESTPLERQYLPQITLVRATSLGYGYSGSAVEISYKYFSIDDGGVGMKIGYDGGTLAKYLQPVSSAKHLISTYRVLRYAAPLLMVFGGAFTVFSFVNTEDHYRGTPSKGVIAGLVVVGTGALVQMTCPIFLPLSVSAYNKHSHRY